MASQDLVVMTAATASGFAASSPISLRLPTAFVGTLIAGKQWGMIHIPRIGQEVIVDFLEGDPDQPIIVGSVYNAEQMPPYVLPDHKTKSTLKTTSTPASAMVGMTGQSRSARAIALTQITGRRMTRWCGQVTDDSSGISGKKAAPRASTG